MLEQVPHGKTEKEKFYKGKLSQPSLHVFLGEQWNSVFPLTCTSCFSKQWESPEKERTESAGMWPQSPVLPHHRIKAAHGKN